MIYPVNLSGGTLCAMARLPVEHIEPAFDDLMRELNCRFSPAKGKEKTLSLDKEGNPAVVGLSAVRGMSEDTWKWFEDLFAGEDGG